MRKLKVFAGVMAALLVFTTGFISCGKKADKKQTANDKIEGLSGSLNLYTWDGMFSPEMLEDFEKASGVKINFTHFDSDEEMLAKLEETKGGSYDVILADDYILEQTIKEGLADKLDKSLLPNIVNVNPIVQNQYYDKENEYTLPFGAGIPLIVYDKEALGLELTSYEDLWKPELKNNLALVGNYRLINGIALKSMGESLNTTDVGKIEKAGEKLFNLAPNVRLISDSNTHEALVSGEVSAAFLYTSQVNSALAERNDLSVCYPKEGLGFGIISAFIPKDAPNKAAAHAFLNYIMQPETGAKYFENLQYFCTFKASEDFINEEMKERLILPEEMKHSEIMMNISTEAEDAHTKVWTKFKAAIG